MRRVLNFLSLLEGRPAFWSSVFFTLMLPWVPIGAEVGAIGEVRSSSLQIFVVLYAIGLGAASRGEVKFGLGVILAVVFSIAYGSILVGENGGGAAQHGGFNLPIWSWLTVFAGVMLFIMHAAERYERHVYNEEPFYEFRNS